ncbi:RNA ligase RtcB family protein [Affinibrenneria salicis]|uniref:3'-phosphate/5'-hydroxy nucleic acid ligase n=1 Tax=Affinibrenneria salicis TaxID=2590031 RepID=A0A5J5FVE4_9GAMM|nr:RNA ligase RtcB family protein [Affinibrenneria salicis]KAA8997732.1 RNA ligase RtcB family protein [Affinibrenneria salicis]
MGNTIRSVAPRVNIIASAETWIEDKAIQQLITTAQLPGMVSVSGMPDLHPGRGYPIGAAFFSQRRFYPALVGNDIGCGMALWRTDLTAGKISLDKLEKRLGNIDEPPDEINELPSEFAELPYSPGTIGGGNHFAELQQLDEIYQPARLGALLPDTRQLLLLVHSGSRGLGQAILEQHVRAFGHRGLEQDTPEAAGYLSQHQLALRFAAYNRQCIAQRMLRRWHSDGEALLDVNHNLVAPAVIDGVSGWLHRKGATPADCGLVVIPGSRGDYSYLVRPLPHAVSLFSLAHGAGRKWMRAECKGRLDQRYSMQQLARTAFGSRVICQDKQLMFQEAPQAYKPIDTVISSMEQAGLIEPIARLKPVLTYKTRGNAQ